MTIEGRCRAKEPFPAFSANRSNLRRELLLQPYVSEEKEREREDFPRNFRELIDEFIHL